MIFVQLPIVVESAGANRTDESNRILRLGDEIRNPERERDYSYVPFPRFLGKTKANDEKQWTMSRVFEASDFSSDIPTVVPVTVRCRAESKSRGTLFATNVCLKERFLGPYRRD